ncbi:MAG: TIGR03564 family F420-dependent LLM class oxidoreductase [Actinomycetia bacterium]|nr:TIGR03564 family F420-dependent LLM class oxidoreductase [Actinomycetes bacterium]MCP4087237.1 TIGR03564 family F420-dependent LLM class oxidoreductase [Actinomycetes bacterium]
MRIAINGSGALRNLDEFRATVRRAREDGMAGVWVSQGAGLDVLTALAGVADEAGPLELGTAVVPVGSRHPQTLAAQALTARQALKGRLTLGIGIGHREVSEGAWGRPWGNPVEAMYDHLTAVTTLLEGRPTRQASVHLTSLGGLDAEPFPRIPVLVGALSPHMLALAGRFADGVVTWCAGSRTVAELVVPTVRHHAEVAGRPAPRLVVGLPVCVSDRIDETRRRITHQAGQAADFPVFRRSLAREGAEGLGDIALVGDEDQVAAWIEILGLSGVTDLVAVEAPGDQREASRTRTLLRDLNR